MQPILRILFAFVCLSAMIFSCSSQQVKDGVQSEQVKENSEKSNSLDLKADKSLAVIYRSEDQGKTWSAFDTGIPKEATLSGILEHQEDLYVTTDFHKVFRRSKDQNQWQTLNNGLPDQLDINCIEAQGQYLVVGTLNQGTFISNDLGANWQASKTDISVAKIRAFQQWKGKLLAGTDSGIYESTDMGDTWNFVHGSMQILGFTTMNNTLYAAANHGAIMSQDDGKTWTSIFEGDALHDIGTDGQNIYAMTIGQKLHQSNDDGKTWNIAQNGIEYPVNFYTNELKHQGSDIYSAQWIGIYHSQDLGNNWIQLRGGLPDATAFSTLEITSYGIIAGISIR